MSNYNPSTPKREKINVWEGKGIVNPKSMKDGDEIKFFPFPNGGGAIHFNLKVEENNGVDERGLPRIKTTYVPVNVRTNKLISEALLRQVTPGMVVKIVGALSFESFKDKTGQQRSSLSVDAYVFQIEQAPAQTPAYMPGTAPYQAVPPQGYQQPAYPYPQQPAYQYPQAPGYPAQMPPQMPPQGYNPAPAYQQPAPAQKPAAQRVATPPAPQGYQPQTPPPYYQPGPQTMPQMPPQAVQPAAQQAYDMDDLPEA